MSSHCVQSRPCKPFLEGNHMKIALALISVPSLLTLCMTSMTPAVAAEPAALFRFRSDRVDFKASRIEGVEASDSESFYFEIDYEFYPERPASKIRVNKQSFA